MAVALLSCPALAQYEPGHRGAWMQQGGQRGDGSDYRQDRGRYRDSSQGRQSDRERGGGSLTPDERRELNRDLQRANREFYRKGREGR